MIAQSVQGDGPGERVPSAVLLPRTIPDGDEVREQLQRILSSPAFHNSKRYAAVLKYIVDQTLEGSGDRLKERTIGIEVFNRPPDYDTATDHAVRSAVAEVRKRLAQYYQQGARGELRIEVLPGSYVPQFRQAEEHRPLSPAALQVDPNPIEQPVAPASIEPDNYRAGQRAWLRPWWLIAFCLVVAASLTGWVMTSRTNGPFESFWNPLLSSRNPVLLCIGNVQGGRGLLAENADLSTTLTLSDFHNSPFETVNVYDTFTIAKIAGLLQANGKQFQFASQSDATFTDLQKGPTILVGLLNNGWTERLLPKLRFSVEQPPSSGKVIIRDRSNPSNQDWSVDYATPYMNLTRDYALVLRMVDPKTEQIVVVVAGITVFGTSAAGDFLISKTEMKKLAAIAPPGWEKKNMELVLSTDVIRGRSGPATIIASQFW